MKIQFATYLDKNKSIVNECEEIATCHNIKNGGTLHFSGLVGDSDVIICAKHNNKVIGYVCLKYYDCLPNGIYIEQIAVSKEYMQKGVGTKLLNNAKHYSAQKGVKSMYANCRISNISSNKLFKLCLFDKFIMDEKIYLMLGFEREDIKHNNAYIYKLN